MGKRIAVTATFWAYAILLVLGARSATHSMLTGWAAKLATMGVVAVGLLPWGRWLRPRIIWVLGFLGRITLLMCYLVLLLPVALIVRLRSDVLKTRRPAAGASSWILRKPLANTLDAARVEY